MDWLTFTVEITKALAWPLTVALAVLLFRHELRIALGRIKRGKLGNAEFEFEDRVAVLRERVGEAVAPNATVTPALTRKAEQDPRTVILSAWLEVQALVEDIVAQHATEEERRAPRSVSLRVLHRILRDKPEYIDMYNDLKDLRNRAVHEPAFAPRSSSVVEYAALAQELGAVLRPYAVAA
jgi:hypothetical protein